VLAWRVVRLDERHQAYRAHKVLGHLLAVVVHVLGVWRMCVLPQRTTEAVLLSLLARARCCYRLLFFLRDTALFSRLSLWIVLSMASQTDLDVALIGAAREGRLEEIRYLLDRRANINAADTFNDTPLHYASFHGHHQCVELLLDRGANINAVGSTNYTPLHLASVHGHHQCVELLLDRGANINAVGCNLNTPLHCASFSGHHQCIELLLDRGANINAVNNNRWTPLHLAAGTGHQQCVELLINRGADKSIRDVREDGRDERLLHLLLI